MTKALSTAHKAYVAATRPIKLGRATRVSGTGNGRDVLLTFNRRVSDAELTKLRDIIRAFL